MSPVEVTLSILAIVGVGALILKWVSGDRSEPAAPEPVDDAVDRLLAEVSGGSAEAAVEVVAITTDGWAFVPDRDTIQLVPPERPSAILPTEDREPQRGRLDAGELIGARVVRGAPDFDPWRLEALGRDGDYRAWFFETEEAARAALALVERRIVRVPIDDDGDPRAPSAADFREARRIDEETERALDDDDP